MAPPRMRAAILYGERDVRIDEIPVPIPGPGEILVEVEAALTDGTDLKVYRRGYHARMIRPPAPFGHEFAGRIAALGPGVEGWRPGVRVVAANSAPCGVCFFCLREQESLCRDLVFVNGAYAQYVLVPERIVRHNLLRVPKSLPSAHAAMTEPLACVIKGVRELGLQRNETVAVFGSGPIGLMATRLLAEVGSPVILVGRRHLDLGLKLGAATILHEDLHSDSISDLPAKLRALTHGRGPDRIFEATGSPSVWAAAVQSVRDGGSVNLFGGCPAETQLSVDTGRIHYGEITIRSSFHHTPRDIVKAFSTIRRNVLDPELFFDGEAPLEKLPEALREMDERKRSLKTIIRPSTLISKQANDG